MNVLVKLNNEKLKKKKNNKYFATYKLYAVNRLQNILSVFVITLGIIVQRMYIYKHNYRIFLQCISTLIISDAS